MSTVLSVAGWLIKIVGARVVENMTDRVLRRVGVLDATCQRCLTQQRSLEVWEHARTTLTCTRCGHQGTILIENIDALTIHEIHFANILVNQAQIVVRDTTCPQRSPEGNVRNLPPAHAAAKRLSPTKILICIMTAAAVGFLLAIISNGEEARREQASRPLYQPPANDSEHIGSGGATDTTAKLELKGQQRPSKGSLVPVQDSEVTAEPEGVVGTSSKASVYETTPVPIAPVMVDWNKELELSSRSFSWRKTWTTVSCEFVMSGVGLEYGGECEKEKYHFKYPWSQLEYLCKTTKGGWPALIIKPSFAGRHTLIVSPEDEYMIDSVLDRVSRAKVAGLEDFRGVAVAETCE